MNNDKLSIIREVLYEIQKDMMITRNLDELLIRIYENIKKVLYAENFFIALYDEVKDEISFPFFKDKYDTNPGPMKNRKSLTDYVLKTGKSLLTTPEILEKITKEYGLELIGTDMESWLGIPLIIQSKAIGVLVVQSYEKEIKYSDDDKNFLEAIASDVALAIERRQSEEELLVLKHSIDSSIDGAYWMDSEGRFIYVNDAGCKALGYSREEILEMNITQVNPNVTFERWKEVWQYIKENKSFTSESTHRRKNGSEFPVEISSVYLKFGNKEYCNGFAKDITERLKAEEKLNQNISVLKTTLDSTADAILVVDLEGKIVDFNKKFIEMWNLPDELIETGKERDLIVSDIDRQLMEIILGQLKNPDKFVTRIKELYKVPEKNSYDVIEFLDGRIIERYSLPQYKDNKPVGRVWSFRDNTERIAAEKALLESEEHYRTLLTSIPDMMFRIDSEGRFTDYYAENYSVLIMPPEDFMWKKYDDVLPPLISEKLKTCIIEAKKTGKHGKFEYGIELPDIGFREYEARVNGFGNECVCIIRDITEKKNQEKELIRTKEKAIVSERLKSSFLANMSHELRTPMVGILGFAELMMELADNDEIKGFADKIQKSGKRLMETLNLILDLSKIEADKIEVKLSLVNLVKLVKEVYDNYLNEAERKKIKLSFNASEEQIISQIDERMLWESVNNLVNNAVKFTNKGKVTIDLFTEVVADKKFAVIKVSDTGIGISPEFIDTIFEEFRQVSEGYSRGFEGTGLGLTITKNFVEKIGGALSVKSKLNEGTIFSIRLPLAVSSIIPLQEKKHPEKQMSAVSKKGTKILCVDDDSITKDFVKFILKDLYSVDFANDGIEAIEKSKFKKYSLILMDINLGKGINGIETAQKIRKISGYKHIPVIALTSYAMKGDKEEFLKSGMDGYISKPFKSAEMIEIIEKFIREKKQ
jgi:PAS domain S-box-containing protein